MAEEVPYAERPTSIKKLRACKGCRLIKNYEQFYATYCENCPHLHPDRDGEGFRDEYVSSHTTPDFEGMVSMMQPDASWVARWLQMHYVEEGTKRRIPFKPGLYAISLPGVEAAEREEKEKHAKNGGYEEDEDEAGEEEAEEDEDEEEAASTSESEGEGRRKGRAAAAAAGRPQVPDSSDPAVQEEAVAAALIAPDDDE